MKHYRNFFVAEESRFDSRFERVDPGDPVVESVAGRTVTENMAHYNPFDPAVAAHSPVVHNTAEVEADRVLADRMAEVEADRMLADRMAEVEVGRMLADHMAEEGAGRVLVGCMAGMEAAVYLGTDRKPLECRVEDELNTVEEDHHQPGHRDESQFHPCYHKRNR